MSHDSRPKIFLARHGQTTWSLSGQHTGTTDLPLTEAGIMEAGELRTMLRGREFANVWSSPRLRARKTCELVGLADRCEIIDELAEWNYGDYEGLKTADIRRDRPGWQIFNDGCPNGESPTQMTERMQKLVARLRLLNENTICFSHGHLLRSLSATWIGQPITICTHLQLTTASLSILGYDGDEPTIHMWNATAAIR